MEGVGTHHFGAGAGNVDAKVNDLLRLIVKAGAGRRSARARQQLYSWVRNAEVIGVIDPLLERIRGLGVDPATVLPTARWLVTEARHRESVKLGIALLGLGHGVDDRNVLKILGRHEEFTLFVAVALANTTDRPERELFDLARTVQGWGRIQLVERLKNSADPEICEWIFREGFRNSVMNEYLAYIAATTGGLVPHLEDPERDDGTIDAACDIVSALLMGGPAEDIDDYKDGAHAVSLLLDVLDRRASKLSHFLVVDDIGEFLARDDDWLGRATRGWTNDVRSRAQERVESIKAQPQWHAMALAGLESEDGSLFYEAERTARTLGYDTFASHWRRLLADPTGGNWYGVMQQANADRIDGIVDFAVRTLPLDSIATGPTTSLGMGPEWASHRALDFVVQDLKRFPGKGWPLISCALQSPVTRNRNMAINALRACDRGMWPPAAEQLLARAYEQEPDDRVRDRLGLLIRDEPEA
jgi:hypothetical protein